MEHGLRCSLSYDVLRQRVPTHFAPCLDAPQQNFPVLAHYAILPYQPLGQSYQYCASNSLANAQALQVPTNPHYLTQKLFIIV